MGIEGWMEEGVLHAQRPSSVVMAHFGQATLTSLEVMPIATARLGGNTGQRVNRPNVLACSGRGPGVYNITSERGMWAVTIVSGFEGQ